MTRAAAEHAAVLAALHGSSFPQPWSEGEFATLLNQPGIASWIARPADDAHEPAGFILVRAAADEAEILTLAVTPGRRRQGFASELVATASRHLRAGTAKRLFLEVAADNGAALALYTALGFARRGLRPAYYRRAGSARIDAIVMVRALRD